MGKVRTGKVKRLAKEIMELHADKVTTDFEKNKLLARSILSGMASRKLSNKVAGYLTALAKRLQKAQTEEAVAE